MKMSTPIRRESSNQIGVNDNNIERGKATYSIMITEVQAGMILCGGRRSSYLAQCSLHKLA